MDQRSETRSTKTRYFIYELILPRPTFTADVSEREAGIIVQHATTGRD
jgi:hypothetical protein